MALLLARVQRLLRSSNEQGSILLIALVSVAVVSLLGLAVYDLALIESNFSAASVIDYRAYEIAQAGMERGIRQLRNIYVAGLPRRESFVETTTTCSPIPCDTTQFHPMSLTNTAMPSSQSLAVGKFANAGDPGGTYTLELKYLTVNEARNSLDAVGLSYPYGLPCFPDRTHGTWCANLAFLRSSGTATDGAGNTRTRTLQTLVRASSTSPWAGGIVAGNGSPAVSGDVLIAGSVHVLGGPSANPAVSIGGGSNAGMMNNWYALDSSSGYSQAEPGSIGLNRLTRKLLICPPATNCVGGANLVESLGAEIKIYGNVDSQMVSVGSGTPLGQSGITPLYGPAPNRRNGKGELDGVYIAGGCALPCIGGAPQPFSSGATVRVDRGNLTKPYPSRPPIGPLFTINGAWPILDDIVTIYNNSTLTATDYAAYLRDWFAQRMDAGPSLNCGGLCTAEITASTPVNAVNCTRTTLCNAGVPLSTLLTSLTDGPGRAFRHAFSFRDRNGNPRSAEVCWMRDTLIDGSGDDRGSAPYPTTTLEFGMPTCDAANTPADPILLRIRFPWGLDHGSGATPYVFRGAAIIVTSGAFHIDETFQSYCGDPLCAIDRFPENHLFALMTENANIDLAFNRAGVERVMGYYFASGANIRVWRDANIIGMLRADTICFRNSSGCSGGVPGGGKVPGFFQASFLDHRDIPQELPAPYEVPGQPSGGRWQVTSVPQFWIECRRGPSETLPPTPSGICGYQ